MAGALKGQRISTPVNAPGLRPILARIKKSLFDILKNSLEGSSFLDLFAGTGSVGLEAVSRGAREVIFIEQDPIYCRRLNEIIQMVPSRDPDFFKGKECKAYRADVMKGLGWLGKNFDLIFSGAPYKDLLKKPLAFVNPLLETIEKDGLLKEKGIFIAQHSIRETFEVPPVWNFFREETYGDTRLSFFKKI